MKRCRTKQASVISRVAVSLAMGAIAAVFFPTPAMAKVRARLDMGLRSMQGRVWDGMEWQGSEGGSIDYAGERWPVEIAFGMHFSEAKMKEGHFISDGGVACIIPFVLCWETGETIERTVARSSLRELSIGVEKFWGSSSSSVRGYIGGGPALVRASFSLEEPAVSARDSAVGLWARAGLLGAWPLGASVEFHWGVELRVLEGTRLALENTTSNADYLQVGLSTGLGW